MLDLQKFFTNFEDLIQCLEPRGISKKQLLIIQEKLIRRKELIKIISSLREKRNKLSREGLKTKEKVEKINEEITLPEKELSELEKGLKELTSQLPNLPASDTPSDNRIITETQYQSNFQSQLTHEKILRKLAFIDEGKSILLSGSKFVVYQDLGSQLLHALISFMRSENSRRGYRLFDTPYLVNDYNLYHTGQLPKFQADSYKIENGNFFLIPTAEVSLVNLYQKQILTEAQLPLKLCAYSPCFREEAGAAGQENKGLIRLHQFHKVELVKIVHPQNSYQELEKLVEDVRNLLHLLKISHRVVELGDKELGFSAAKTYDIEVWMPVSKKWLEISSCSNCEDFQSRRAQIRIKDKEGKKYFPHTLNGSALAVDRLITVLCEYYYQEKENKFAIPEILKRFFF